jgi:hypothetical protein
MGRGGCPSRCRGGRVSLVRSVPAVGGDGWCGLWWAEGEKERVAFGERSTGWSVHPNNR